VSAQQLLLARGLLSERDYYRQLAQHLGIDYLTDDLLLAADLAWREALASGHARLADGRWLIAPRGTALALFLERLAHSQLTGHRPDQAA
jgi:hypothetical protein